jgi:hypothetical protein
MTPALYSYIIVRLSEKRGNLLFIVLIRVISSKTCLQTDVAIEQPGCMLIELMADEEACVKVPFIEEVEYKVDELGKEQVEHPPAVVEIF